jgi:hypothetical protein
MTMNRWTRLAAWLIPAVAFVHACGGDAQTDSTSGNTNWLKLCDKQADCGEGLSCLCNTCQVLCTRNADCDLAGLGSRCAVQPSSLACGDASSEGERVCVKGCDVDADCERNDLICLDEVCVPRTASSTPDAFLDATTSDGSSPDAAPREDAADPLPDGTHEPVDSASTGPSADGEGYSVAYAFPGVWNTRSDCSASFDADGNMTAYSFSPSEHLEIGSATFAGADTDGLLAWGRWTGGSIEGVFGGDDVATAFPEITDSFHYAVGRGVPTNLPGESIYNLIGLTTPSTSDGSAMSLDDLAIAIDFDTGQVGAESTVTTSYGNESFATTGGVIDLSATEGLLETGFLFEINLQNHASSCEVYGAVVGEDATDLVVSYRVSVLSYEDGGAAPGLELYGTAVLRRPILP